MHNQESRDEQSSNSVNSRFPCTQYGSEGFFPSVKELPFREPYLPTLPYSCPWLVVFLEPGMQHVCSMQVIQNCPRCSHPSCSLRLHCTRHCSFISAVWQCPQEHQRPPLVAGHSTELLFHIRVDSSQGLQQLLPCRLPRFTPPYPITLWDFMPTGHKKGAWLAPRQHGHFGGR